MKKIEIWCSVIFFLAFSISFCSGAPRGSLENFGMSYIGSGYASPVDFFNNNATIFQLGIGSDYFILNSSGIANVKIIATLQGGYIFKRGWLWNSRIGDWIPFEFNYSGISGSYWINGSGLPKTASLNINATNTLENGLNFIALFSCKKYNNEWKCGCGSAQDTSCNKWALLAFNVSQANWTLSPERACVVDSECNQTTGERCTEQTCQIFSCTNDSQCTEKRKCLAGVCLECTNDINCPFPEKCFSNRCFECLNDSNCQQGEKCFGNICAQCVNDSQCDAGKKCANRFCRTPVFCYQESANITNQTGIDGNCGLNYSGSYEFASSPASSCWSSGGYGYIYINYTKPLNMLGAFWQVKHGVAAAYNVTLPSECFNAYANKASLRMYSFGSNNALGGNVTKSYGECYNGSVWKIITSIPQHGGDAPSVEGGGSQNTFDGNWNTHGYHSCSGTWYVTTGSPLGRTVLARIFEEAIIWWKE